MKKTRINLLTRRENFIKAEKYFIFLRHLTVGYSVFLVSIVGVLLFFILRQNSTISSLQQQKRDVLLRLSSRKDDEAKLIYIAKKMDAYNAFIKDDARFVPYYNLLANTLKTSSESATLTSFVVNKQREVDFVLSFSRLEDMLASFSFVESRMFLQNFEELLLTQFTSQTTDRAKRYELSFSGKFINLDEKNR